MKASVVVTRDAEKIPREAVIKVGRKRLKIKYIYSPDGDVYGFEVKGRRELLPSVTDIFKIVDAKRLDRIGTIEVIDLIKLIEEITTIKNIEVIGSMPDITIRGSEGIGFRQATGAGGGWVSPTGHSDPDSKWSDEAKAYDDDTGTAATNIVSSDSWGSYIHLTHAALNGNKLRYRSEQVPMVNKIDIDILKDGVWVDVYEGSPGTTNTWHEKTFSQGLVTEVRIRFYNDAAILTQVSLKEFDFYQVATSGGEAYVKQAGGTILYTALQIKAMTTGVDTVILTVPTGKRWLLHYGRMMNYSGATIGISCYIKGSGGSIIDYPISQAAAAHASKYSFPYKEGTERTNLLGHGAYPMLLDAGMSIAFQWNADAGKTGNSYWFAMIEEFTP